MVSKIQIGEQQKTKFLLKKHPQKAEYQYVKMARPGEAQISSEQQQEKSYESMAMQMSKQHKGKFQDESMQMNLELVNQNRTEKTYDVDLDGEVTTQMNQSGKATASKKPSQLSNTSQQIRGWSGKESKQKPPIKNINFW